MSQESIVLDCAKLKGTDYDVQLSNTNGEIIGNTISDLYSPPLPDTNQLEKDLNRDGIIVNDNGTITLCKTLAEFQALDYIPDHIKNYILRVGHQGLFGGQASSTGPGNIARDIDNKSLIQDSLLSDSPLVLSIKDEKTTLVQTTNYAYTEFMETDRLGNLQLSLVADLTDLPKDLGKENPLELSIPISLVASGDHTIMAAIRGTDKSHALVLGGKNSSIQEAIRSARNDKLSLLTPEKLLSTVLSHKANPANAKDILENTRLLEEYVATDIVKANNILDITTSIGAQLSPQQISRILMSSQGTIEHSEYPIEAKQEFFTRILGYVSKLEPEAKQAAIGSLNTALANIQKDGTYNVEYDMLSRVITKAKIQGIEQGEIKKPSMIRRLSSMLRKPPSPTSESGYDSPPNDSPPPTTPTTLTWTERVSTPSKEGPAITK